MATPVIEPREATSRDPWATAPVAVGHHHRRPGWMLLLLLVAAATLAFLLSRTVPTDPSTTAPAPAPNAPQAPASVPFDVTVEVTHVRSMDNDGLFGKGAAVPDGAPDAAAQQVAEVLQRYLDAAFVLPETRFTDQPLAGLLSPRASAALSQEDLAGLGALDVAVQQARAEPVTATAQVLTSGADAVVVEIRYDARAQVVADDGAEVPLRQRSTMVFVPDGDGWRAEAVDAVLDLPLPAGEVTR